MAPNRRTSFGFNLAWLLALGVFASWWAISYSEWFPTIGSLLSLGGLFSWVAFVSGLIRDNRKEEFRLWVERLLGSTATQLALFALTLLSVGAASFFGSIDVVSRGNDIDRSVTIRDATTGLPVSEALIPTGGEMKSVVRGNWFRESLYLVKVDGFPVVRASVGGFGRSQITIPNSFYGRSVILMRPGPGRTSTFGNTPARLAVNVNGIQVGMLEGYRGESVWIGCDRDVTIPRHTLDRWHLDVLGLVNGPAAFGRWQHPLSLAQDVYLSPGDTLRVVFGSEENASMIDTAVLVAKPAHMLDFPQVLIIE